MVYMCILCIYFNNDKSRSKRVIIHFGLTIDLCMCALKIPQMFLKLYIYIYIYNAHYMYNVYTYVMYIICIHI